jgi:SAM-dependent methyltransferase
MAAPLAYSYVRYLHAKRSVDDRALNRVVLEQLREALAALPAAASTPPRVLELGAGVGTMVSRLADLGWLTRARYTLLDSDRTSLDAAAAHLRDWGGAAARDQGGAVVVRDAGRDLEARAVEADVFDWLAAPEGSGEPYDLVIANAFLDLVDVGALLPLLWRRVAPGRPFWFSINFDGETIFLPEQPLDNQVSTLYHRDMDQRLHRGHPTGGSRTGRLLLQEIPRSGARLLGAGSSDWVVLPSGDGGYPGDEGYFLHQILHTIETALRGSPAIDAAAFEGWLEERREQIDRGELIYVTHQLDVFGRAPSDSRSSTSAWRSGSG